MKIDKNTTLKIANLSRIKINEKNTRTADITIPKSDHHVYFFLIEVTAISKSFTI